MGKQKRMYRWEQRPPTLAPNQAAVWNTTSSDIILRLTHSCAINNKPGFRHLLLPHPPTRPTHRCRRRRWRRAWQVLWLGGRIWRGAGGWPGNKVFECENDCCCVMFTVVSDSEQQITLSGTHPCGMGAEQRGEERRRSFECSPLNTVNGWQYKRRGCSY